MSLVEISWHPSRKELRNFAIIAPIAAALVSLVLFLHTGLGIQWAAVIFAVGVVIFLSSLVSIKLTRIIYLGLILVTLPIGYVVSFLLLAIFYFLLMTPLALVFRLIGRDALHRKFDPDTSSYWIAHRQPGSLDRYFHQF